MSVVRSPLRASWQEHRRGSRGRGTVLAAAWACAVPYLATSQRSVARPHNRLLCLLEPQS